MVQCLHAMFQHSGKHVVVRNALDQIVKTFTEQAIMIKFKTWEAAFFIRNIQRQT